MRKILTRPLMLVALTVMAACVQTVSPAGPSGGGNMPAPSREPIIVGDRGGNVMAAIQRRNELARSGRPVEVRGYCGSACTLYITLPNACLGPRATVGFHAPRIPGTTIIPQGVDNIMGSYYRNGIKRRWDAEWKHSLEIQKITAREYVRLDPQTRLCAN